MELKFLKDDKDGVKIQFEQDQATLAMAVKDELWNTKGVEVAAVDKHHPLVGKPELTVHAKEARKLVKTATLSFKKKVEEFEKAILKEI
jgi:DNA-directed RNA polymerase subunit L